MNIINFLFKLCIIYLCTGYGTENKNIRLDQILQNFQKKIRPGRSTATGTGSGYGLKIFK